jgi:hypothetical protein
VADDERTNPWTQDGKPFRPDRPEWQRVPTTMSDSDINAMAATHEAWYKIPGNCIANRPFREWIKRICFDAMDTGLYGAWCMDGDFWGYGGYYHTTVPVTCASDQHDHLPVDANYACQRALDEMIAEVRRRYPHLLMVMARPPMD